LSEVSGVLEILFHQIILFGFIGADVRQSVII
jgi:hypothetical protein